MKLLRAMSICSLLLTSAVISAMLPPMTDADIEQSEHEAEQKEQWEAEHPGQVYQGCSPIRKLKPGYVIDKAGHVVLAATANNKQTNSAADEYTPIKN